MHEPKLICLAREEWKANKEKEMVELQHKLADELFRVFGKDFAVHFHISEDKAYIIGTDFYLHQEWSLYTRGVNLFFGHRKVVFANNWMVAPITSLVSFYETYERRKKIVEDSLKRKSCWWRRVFGFGHDHIEVKEVL